MPTDVQVTIQGNTNLPEDRFVHTLHFDGDQWDEGLADELWAKWMALKDQCLGGHAESGHRIAAYAPGLNPEGPYFAKDYSAGAASLSSAPSEVAVCLSYAAVDDPEAATASRRGRVYMGPFAPGLANSSRPSPTIRDAVLAYGQGIAQVGLASNVTWVMRSAKNASYHKIESIWVDDAWDTQRRRGLRPTSRVVQDVQ